MITTTSFSRTALTISSAYCRIGSAACAGAGGAPADIVAALRSLRACVRAA